METEEHGDCQALDTSKSSRVSYHHVIEVLFKLFRSVEPIHQWENIESIL